MNAIARKHAPSQPVTRILLLEKDRGYVQLLRWMLEEESAGIILEPAERLEAALERLRHGGVELILTDLAVPGSDKTKTLARLRQAAAEIPIIVLCDPEDQKTGVRAVEHGADDYLVKGHLDYDSLMRSLRYALDQSRSRRELEKARVELAQHRADAAIERGRAAAELDQTLARLRQAQATVIQQERLHALGRMASGIAHDFNNTLVPIVGLSELLLNPSATTQAKSQEYLRLIYTAATDGAEVVRRLREFYRYREEGDILSAVSLNEIVRQVVALTKPRWKDQALGRGAQIDFVTELALVPPVWGCEAELRELLINLVFNSADAIEHNGTITCRTFRSGSSVALQVSDTGIGMADKVRQRCLEPFFSTKGDDGTGLGLAMIFGTVRRHDGEIDIQSALGRGTTITVSLLPYDEIGAPERAFIPAPRPPPLKILVVDDEPSVREVLSAILQEDGHAVGCAANGDEALQLYKQEQWDLVMTDRAMPQMNGDLLAAALKQLHPDTPVILITGFADVMDGVGDHPTATDLVIRKPFNRDSLRAAIAQVLPRKVTAECVALNDSEPKIDPRCKLGVRRLS